jgi:hypothetical protein
MTTLVRQRRLAWPVGGALLAAAGLAGLYLGLVTLAESWPHALELFREDTLFVVPIMVGFGAQVGLFIYLKRGLHLPEGTGPAGALTGAAGGTSTLAMVACCAHHLTDVLPLVGLSAAAVFLGVYKTWFLAAGLAANLVGIGVMLRLLYRQRQQFVARLQTLEAYRR